MDTSVIFQSISIKATAEDIFKALTTEEGLKGWWVRDLKKVGKNQVLVKFEFGVTTVWMSMSIDHSSRIIRWDCVDGPEDWVGTTMTFEIIPHGLETVLHLWHSGLKGSADFYGQCNSRWGHYLHGLKLLVEPGIELYQFEQSR